MLIDDERSARAREPQTAADDTVQSGPIPT